MIDPTRITNFELPPAQLEEMILFWVLVAGKNASATVRMLDELLARLHEDAGLDGLQPFRSVREYHDAHGVAALGALMMSIGFGCHGMKSRAIAELSRSKIDLATCTSDELESCFGIGPKTARCFLIHTRKGARHAGLDTHVLKFLRDRGIDAPVATPSRSAYARLESAFISIADDWKMSIPELDLAVWNAYRLGSKFLGPGPSA